MAWQTTLVTMVRNIINDLGTTETYDDNRIEEAIVISGIFVSQDYLLTTSYTFDVDAISIIPDPVVNFDPIAIALFTLKASCMLSLNSYQTAIKGGIRVRDGDSEVDTTTGFGGYRDLLKLGPCGAYSNLLQVLSRRRSSNVGKAVGTPLNHWDHLLPPFGYGPTGDGYNRSFFDSFCAGMGR